MPRGTVGGAERMKSTNKRQEPHIEGSSLIELNQATQALTAAFQWWNDLLAREDRSNRQVAEAGHLASGT